MKKILVLVVACFGLWFTGSLFAGNEVCKTFFSKPYPARSALGASGLAFGARVEVECIAAVDK